MLDEFKSLIKDFPVEGEIEQFKYLVKKFPKQIVFSTSFGIEDQAITHLIFENNIDIKIFTLDTGRHFEETYKTLDTTKKRYKKDITVFFPETEKIENLVSKKGMYSFYDSIENRKECCNIRKVEPLKRALKNNKIWVTGIRAEQSITRSNTTLLEYDEAFNIIKFNPLLHWNTDKLNNFIHKNNIPINSLHSKNFLSIGCAPCTRAVKSGEDIRSGRWWWENPTTKECGLHTK